NKGGSNAFASGFDGGTGFAAFSSSSSFGSAGGGNMRSTSTSTKVINGKRIKTTKILENGKETITVEEDGKITSRMIDGTPAMITQN
ncbi:hypothetical protein, partial [Salmonella sp. s55962]|uniref:hypothetical protein n=1 Tax=Salmonella sp. s55962 TaxID=3159685 RepID=UPI003980D980